MPLFNPNFGGVPVAPDRPCWTSARAEALSYSAVKLFSKNSNVFEHGTWTLRTDRRTDGQTTYCRITALCASIARWSETLHTVILQPDSLLLRVMWWIAWHMLGKFSVFSYVCSLLFTVMPRLLLRTNSKSHTRFRLVPKSIILDDIKRPKRHSCRNGLILRSPPTKFEWR